MTSSRNCRLSMRDTAFAEKVVSISKACNGNMSYLDPCIECFAEVFFQP